MLVRVISFASCKVADLVVDAVYEARSDGQLSGEPISKLLPGSGKHGRIPSIRSGCGSELGCCVHDSSVHAEHPRVRGFLLSSYLRNTRERIMRAQFNSRSSRDFQEFPQRKTWSIGAFDAQNSISRQRCMGIAMPLSTSQWEMQLLS